MVDNRNLFLPPGRRKINPPGGDGNRSRSYSRQTAGMAAGLLFAA